jgi:hypothetical protein
MEYAVYNILTMNFKTLARHLQIILKHFSM